MVRYSSALVLAAMLSVAVLSVTVVADGSDGVTGADGIEYETSPGYAYVSGYTGDDDTVTIPSTVTLDGIEYQVTGINTKAFGPSSGVTEIHIPSSVMFIDNSAFYGCTSLKMVFIEGSPMIGSSAFMGCENLEFISLSLIPIKVETNAFALGADASCTVRAPQGCSLDAYSNGADLTYISPDRCLVRYALSGAPEGVSEPGYDLIPADTVLTIPSAAQTEGYDIAMSIGGTPVESGYRVSGDIEVTLTYKIQSFTITFMNGEQVYHSYPADYFSEIVLPAEDPVREPTDQYTYTFSGWVGYRDGMTVSSAHVFEAGYNSEVNRYDIVFRDGDRILKSDNLRFGEAIVPPEDPVREPTETTSYTFKEWNGYTADMTVSGDMTFDAVFEEGPRLYRVQFLVDDAEYAGYDLAYGQAIVPPAETPVKAQDPAFTYTFSRWEGYTDGMTVTGDIAFKALFDSVKRSYTIVFVSDGLAFSSQTLGYDEVITAPAQDPVKAQDAQYIYEFSGWDGYTEGMKVTGDATFQAVYATTLREYTVVFESEGEVVKQEVLPYGTVITAPAEDPVKEPSDGKQYTFRNWFGYTEGMTVTGDHAFVARFVESDLLYTILFVSEGETVSEQKLMHGEAIVPPAEDPVKESEGSVSYRFSGWEGYTEGMTADGDATFQAVFEEVRPSEGGISLWIVAVIVIAVIAVAAVVIWKRFL